MKDVLEDLLGERSIKRKDMIPQKWTKLTENSAVRVPGGLQRKSGFLLHGVLALCFSKRRSAAEVVTMLSMVQVGLLQTSFSVV